MRKKDDTPPGGWLGPPPSEGLKPLKVAKKAGRSGWLWQDVPQSREDKETRAEWERRMKKADAKGKWRFKWPRRSDEG